MSIAQSAAAVLVFAAAFAITVTALQDLFQRPPYAVAGGNKMLWLAIFW